jgi:carbamate kinase
VAPGLATGALCAEWVMHAMVREDRYPVCFVEAAGGMAAIGRLGEAEALLDGKAGTIITP